MTAASLTRHRLRHCAYANWAWQKRKQGDFVRASQYARLAMCHWHLMRLRLERATEAT